MLKTHEKVLCEKNCTNFLVNKICLKCPFQCENKDRLSINSARDRKKDGSRGKWRETERQKQTLACCCRIISSERRHNMTNKESIWKDDILSKDCGIKRYAKIVYNHFLLDIFFWAKLYISEHKAITYLQKNT